MKMIAIVPTPEWHEALLGPGPGPNLSQEPPVITHDGTKWTDCFGYDVKALPLLWEGQPVPDGIARAVRAMYSASPEYSVPGNYAVGATPVQSVGHLYLFARLLESKGIAAEVITDL